jgi:hypothetical protein
MSSSGIKIVEISLVAPMGPDGAAQHLNPLCSLRAEALNVDLLSVNE